jgi:hypothetical protein
LTDLLMASGHNAVSEITSLACNPETYTKAQLTF